MPNPISDELALIPDPALRAARKAQRVGEFPGLAGRSWTRTIGARVYVLTLLDAPSLSGSLLRLRLGLTRNGTSVPLFGGDGSLLIANPPVLVDDPAGDIVRTSTDAKGVVTTRALREDVAEALRIAVFDAVKDSIR